VDFNILILFAIYIRLAPNLNFIIFELFMKKEIKECEETLLVLIFEADRMILAQL